MKKISLIKIGSCYMLSVRENGKQVDGMIINQRDEFTGRELLKAKHGIGGAT